MRHIVCTPGIVGGEPRIADHRIRVRDIVAARDLGGFTPEEIASSVYPNLSLAQVYSALAYYEDHREEIDQLFRGESRFAEEFQAAESAHCSSAAISEGMNGAPGVRR